MSEQYLTVLLLPMSGNEQHCMHNLPSNPWLLGSHYACPGFSKGMVEVALDIWLVPKTLCPVPFGRCSYRLSAPHVERYGEHPKECNQKVLRHHQIFTHTKSVKIQAQRPHNEYSGTLGSPDGSNIDPKMKPTVLQKMSLHKKHNKNLIYTCIYHTSSMSPTYQNAPRIARCATSAELRNMTFSYTSPSELYFLRHPTSVDT